MTSLSPRIAHSRGIALTSLLSAVYVALALLSSYILGFITHGMDTFIFRSLLFVILVGLTSGFGYSTMMGGISGLVLEFTIPTPVRFYLFPSLLAYGFVFDVIINFQKPLNGYPSTAWTLLGTAFASMAMSAVALVVFSLVGFFPPQLLLVIWTLGIARDVFLGIIGAVIGVVLMRQLTYLKST
ncbi:MAG: hypothetical protein ACXADB_08340 [Candidatus Hermodarchaeia archaeon]|jgi:hypothetical protein